ncbi:MAG TPA: hypothetical protein VLM85_24600 [Polyangiaceae bacterium]|nr:hypothetical protein [Polyangiaceae bacterium]
MKLSLAVSAAVLLVSCKGSGDGAAEAAAPSAQPSSAPTITAELVTRGKWWTVASKSRVYTEDRRIDADNALRVLPPVPREQVRTTLEDMAKQSPDAAGLRAASMLAREGQSRVEDTHDPAPKAAMAQTGYIVLHGLIAEACEQHKDAASLAALLAAIREMPLPHVEKSNGLPERGVLEQEMRMALDDKTMHALLSNAPGPKKNF